MTREELYQGVIGTELKADNPRDGVIDDGNIAWDERVFQARKQWPEASPADFERVGKRLWRDRGSGIEYRQCHGAPLLGVGTDSTRFVSAFFIEDGRIVFLERNDIDRGSYVRHGEFYGAKVVNGQIIKET